MGQTVVVWESLKSKFTATIIKINPKWITVDGEKNGRKLTCKVKREIIAFSKSEIPDMFKSALEFDFKHSGINRQDQLVDLLNSTKTKILPIIEKIFDNYQKNHFNSVNIQWGSRITFRNLGWYKMSKNLIQISKSLQNTPDFVIMKTIWHELLHIKFNQSQGQKAHSPNFRRYENLYPRFKEADEFVQSYYTKLRSSR